MSEFITTARGDRVAFDRRGSGPGLVFVAGAGPYRAIDPATTATAESAARQGITTIVYDRLGRGDSVAAGRIGLDRELSALTALIEIAGGSAVLCGHSSGCSIALAATVAKLPVDGLALWEAPLNPKQGDVSEWAAEVERRMDSGELESALEYFMKDMPPEWLDAARQSPTFPQMVAQVVSQRADAESLAWTDSAPHSDLFGGIRVPVQVMLGTETFVQMLAAADSIVAAIPGAIQKRMPGAGHAWEPEPMAAELAAFVKAAK